MGIRRAALHSEHRGRIVTVNSMMDSLKLHRTLKTVYRAGKSKGIAQHLQDQVFWIDNADQSADRHHQKAESDVNTLFTGCHVKPHLEHVMRNQNQKDADCGHQNPGPAHILPVCNCADRILFQMIKPGHF